MIKELFIVRHGETNFNLEERAQGQIDSESYLSAKGLEQVEELGKTLKSLNTPFDKIYSSDQRRARQTAEGILNYLEKVPIELTADLRERGFGHLEGKTIYECGIKDYKGAELYSLDQEGILADSESLTSIQKRIKNLINNILASPHEKIILVGHEWINSYISNMLLDEEHIFHAQDNTGIHYFKLNDNGKMIAHKLNNEEYKLKE